MLQCFTWWQWWTEKFYPPLVQSAQSLPLVQDLQDFPWCPVTTVKWKLYHLLCISPKYFQKQATHQWWLCCYKQHTFPPRPPGSPGWPLGPSSPWSPWRREKVTEKLRLLDITFSLKGIFAEVLGSCWVIPLPKSTHSTIPSPLRPWIHLPRANLCLPVALVLPRKRNDCVRICTTSLIINKCAQSTTLTERQ